MAQGIAESVQRRRDLKAAMDSSVKGETLTMEEMQVLWGVSAGRMTTIRNQIPNMPKPVVAGKKHFYPRVETLAALWDWEHRGDREAATKTARMAKLLGVTDADASTAMLSISELQKLSQVRAETDNRLIEQGKLLALTAVQHKAGQIFEFLARRLSTLGTGVDPNGKLPAPVRAAADKLGQEWLLRVHADLKHMLAPDAAVHATGSGKARGGPGRARVSPAPRPAGSRVAKPAGSAAATAKRDDKPVDARRPGNEGGKRARK